MPGGYSDIDESSLLTRIDALERQVRDVTLASRGDRFGTEDGTVKIGQITHPDTGVDTTGILITDDQGEPVLQVTPDGLDKPSLQVPMLVAASFEAVTSATWVDVYEVRILHVTAKALRVRFTLQTHSTVTLDARLVIAGVTTSGTLTSTNEPGGAEYNFLWEPPATWSVGVQNLLIKLQAQRSAGADFANIYIPQLSQAGSDFLGATTTGI